MRVCGGRIYLVYAISIAANEMLAKYVHKLGINFVEPLFLLKKHVDFLMEMKREKFFSIKQVRCGVLVGTS